MEVKELNPIIVEQEVNKELQTNPVLRSFKKAWEKQYGENADTRTPKQWKALVDIYGFDEVCKKSNVNPIFLAGQLAKVTTVGAIKEQIKNKKHAKGRRK